ncbi:glyoxal reductase-like isoform X3 [Pelodiscus sinensis]|uniref:glyoxal reductase-like isoform X3 n=1 Tax=Pelodiscus sinensis TaxID=13735 RepID=UPI003F6A746C
MEPAGVSLGPTEQTVLLNSGTRMPLLGMGTFRLQGAELVSQCVEAALAHGYRSFDTATVYHNERAMGQALGALLPLHGLERSDIFLTTKLGPQDQGKAKAEAACLRSLEQLACSYLDLYLIHWPGTQGKHQEDKGNRERRWESWQILEQMHHAGHLRAIGVSNYTLQHLQELLAHCRVPPAVLQVEFHPELPQRELWDFCRHHGIHLQAYASLGCGQLLGRAEVERVAERRGRTPAQVLLRWALHQGVGVIPKSASPTRLAENAQLWGWDLSPEDMAELAGMDCSRHYCWDPSGVT